MKPGMPRCSHSCPTESCQHFYLTEEEMEAKIKEEELSELRPELNAKPHVFYKNLYRYTKNFITGALLKDNDVVIGASVTCEGEGMKETQVTDYFGEFKFDKLEPGTYTLSMDGKTLKEVTIKESINIGEIVID